MKVPVRPFRYAFSTNAVTTSFTNYSATSTEPTGDGVIDLASPLLGVGSQGGIPTRLQLMPFGTDADNETFDLRVYGYSPTLPTDLVTDTVLYVPQLLLDVSAILCARTFSDHTANAFLVDTLTVNLGAADNAEWRSLISPGGTTNAAGSIVLHARGCRYLRFDVDLTGAAAANCMWRPLDD